MNLAQRPVRYSGLFCQIASAISGLELRPRSMNYIPPFPPCSAGSSLPIKPGRCYQYAEGVGQELFSSGPWPDWPWPASPGGRGLPSLLCPRSGLTGSPISLKSPSWFVPWPTLRNHWGAWCSLPNNVWIGHSCSTGASTGLSHQLC